MSAERITGVAIRTANEITISHGEPHRHHHLIAELRRLGLSASDISASEQGFRTSDGRFVNRIEAAEIAQRAGQLKAPMTRTELFSEDLW